MLQNYINMKNKIRKIAILYLIISLSIILINCLGGGPDLYKVEALNSQPQRIIDIHQHNEGANLYLVENIYTAIDTVKIRYDSLIIETSMQHYLAQNNIVNNIGIQPAYAWSKVKNYERIDDIIITSNKDYNSEYPSGTNLSNILNIRNGSYSVKANISIAHFLQNFDTNNSEDVYYTFTIAPEFEDIHTITIKYITENNNVFETKVENLKISN